MANVVDANSTDEEDDAVVVVGVDCSFRLRYSLIDSLRFGVGGVTTAWASVGFRRGSLLCGRVMAIFVHVGDGIRMAAAAAAADEDADADALDGAALVRLSIDCGGGGGGDESSS